MTYYDHIAKQWHVATGYEGGAFKKLVLNEVILDKISAIENCAILELGAGNGYFLPMVLHRLSGQIPSMVVVTDLSPKLLEIAQRNFRIPDATYRVLDVRRPFPFSDSSFDLILALMVFNEVPYRDFRQALRECFRVLAREGVVLIAVTHPEFVDSLRRRGELRRTEGGVLTMPGAGSLRLPVEIRSVEKYQKALAETGFQYEEEAVHVTRQVLNEKPGLRGAIREPVALVYKCVKGQPM